MKAPAGCLLTDNQWEAMRLLSLGLTREQSALQMGVSLHSLDMYLWRIKKKVGGHSTRELVERYSRGELAAVPDRKENWDITPAQRLYLEAFDRLLLGANELARLRARKDMRFMLSLICDERQIELPGGGKQRRDLLARSLVDDVLWLAA